MNRDRTPDQQQGTVASHEHLNVDVDDKQRAEASRGLSVTHDARLQPQYSSQGNIPPPMTGFETPAPTASERAYGVGPKATAARLNSTKPRSQTDEIQMPDEYVGKPDVEMPPDYLGNEPGEKYRHEGAVCDRPGAVGACFFDPGYRQRLVEDLNSFVPGAEARYLSALQTARIDELLKKAPKLGLAAELLIGALGVLGGALLNGAAAMAIKELNRRAVWKDAMKPSAFEGAVAAQSNHMRSVIGEATGIAKGRAKLAFTGATPQSQIKEAFLAKLMNDAGPVLHVIRNDVLDSGDDLALAVAAKLFSPDVFTYDACTLHVRSMLDRLEHQNLDEIGPFKSGAVQGAGEIEIARLEAFGQQRLAVVRFSHRVKIGRMYGDDWYTRDGEEFMNWVDDDFGEFATGVQENRNGAMKTIDVSMFPDRFGPEVKSWIDRTRKGAAR